VNLFITRGIDLNTAYFKMESLEFYAQLCFLTEQLGGGRELPEAEVRRLLELRRQMNAPGRHSLIDGKG
jgi:L-fuculose-phosphate aldolase